MDWFADKLNISSPAPAPPAQAAQWAAGPVGPPVKASDRLYDLLLTQQADGSFALVPALLDWLGAAEPKIREASRVHGESVVATAAALFLLARDEAKRESEWRLAAQKAETWLRKQGTTVDIQAIIA